MSHWIFQLSPEHFDIMASDERERPLRFEAKIHNHHMQPGDTAVIWISGQAAGAYGIATLAANDTGALDIYDRLIKPNTGWLKPEDIGTHKRTVSLADGHWFFAPILKTELLEDSRFAGSLIMYNPHRPNPFPITDEELDAIMSRLRPGVTAQQ
jgi:hypothetical protein